MSRPHESPGTARIGDAYEEACDRELEQQGYIVDKRKGRKFQAQDTFGCLDRIALKPDSPALGVQVTSGGNAHHRKRKVERSIGMVYKPGSALASHLTVEVWEWGRHAESGRTGFKKERYLGGYGKKAWVTVARRGVG